MVNLKIKLLMLISGIIAIVVIGIGIVTIYREKVFLHEQNDRLGLAIAHDAARYSADAIISRDIYSLLKLIKLTMKQDYVTHVIILDPDGKVLATYISKPIRKITSAMESVASGNLSVSVEFKSGDEIGRLAATFNKMAEDLRKTTVSRDFVDNIIKSMADALIVANPEGTIIRFNQTTLDLVGYIEDELLKKPMDMIFENELLKKPLLEEIIEKDFISEQEKNCLTKDGRKIPVLFSGSVMHNTDGKIEAIVCVAQDISKLKKAEVALKRSYE